MVRLLRLETDDVQGRFDTLFNEDVVIKKDTKIALHSLSAETNYDNIVINRSNDIIKYKIATNPEQEIQLASVTYQLNNINSLFNDIQQKLNNSLASNATNNIGIEWFCNDSTGKVNIGYNECLATNFDKVGLNTTVPGNPQQTMVNVTRVGITANAASGRQTFRSSSGADSALNVNYMYQTNDWCKGSAFFRAKPANGYTANADPVDTFNSGFRIALMDVHPSTITPGTAILENNIFCSLRINRPGQKYRIKTSLVGVESDAGDVPIDATVTGLLEMMCVGSNIRFRVYRDGEADPDELDTIAIPTNADGSRLLLYPVTIFYRNGNNCTIDNYRCSTSFPVKFNDAIQIEEQNDLGLGVYPNIILPQSRNRNITFTINSATLYEALGFTQSAHAQRNRHLDLFAGNTFQLTNQSDCIIVELANITLDSYDSLTEGRKSILNCIALNDKQVSVNYEMKNLVYIDVKNDSDRLMRNIKINLLRHDHTALLTRGKTSLVLLLSE